MIEVEEFRAEVRAWYEANAEQYRTTDLRDLAAARRYRAALYEAGLLGITVDERYGGRGLTGRHQKAFNEVVAQYPGLPGVSEPMTTGVCAPVLLQFGTEEQKVAYVPKMLSGEHIWAQLLSEPGAGSDLGGIQTRAVRDGDEYVISGQKVWTSNAHISAYALCVARTDPDVPKHRGLSVLIVPMSASGITIRPLRQITGEAHFNEVFLDDVRVPVTSLVGEENDGWRGMLAALTFERLALGAGTGLASSGQGWARPSSERFIEVARSRGVLSDPAVRQELMKLYVLEKVLGFMGQKMRDEIAAGVDVGSRGSLGKLAGAALSRQSSSLGMSLAGPVSQAWDPDDDAKGRELAFMTAMAPMLGIAGGTSEIQRNTIGERVLGLPKEPQVDRDIPFRETLQNPQSQRTG